MRVYDRDAVSFEEIKICDPSGSENLVPSRERSDPFIFLPHKENAKTSYPRHEARGCLRLLRSLYEGEK